MARKSRFTAHADITAESAVPMFNTAGYVRRSDEDEDGMSIENQTLMARKYIEQTPGLKLQGIYTDNGVSGTSFQRAGFNAMLEEIRRGNVNCIVVKDLSRFGRDYIEAGNYLETVFPRLGVRFISIVDNYDSFDPRCQGDGITVALKNMLNAYYAKDISMKMRAVYDVRLQKGEYISAFAPFGYARSPESKSKLIIDPEAAEVVRKIFKWRIEGVLYREIARRLNEAGIPSPARYAYLKGIRHEERFAGPMLWEDSSIAKILSNMVYAGHMALGKSKNIQMNKLTRLPKENWYFTYNTHEPIVSQADFDAVAEIMQKNGKRRKENRNNRQSPPLPDNIFKGILFCKVCGRSFTRNMNDLNRDGHRKTYYKCRHCANNGLRKGKRLRIGLEDLKTMVFDIIMAQISACADERALAEKKRLSDPITRTRENNEREIQNIRQRIASINSRKERLLCDYYDGLLTKADYQLISTQRDTESQKLTDKLKSLLLAQERFQPEFWDKNTCVSAFTQFYEAKELTRDMLEKLVERIDVTEDRDIEIRFKFRDEFAALTNFNGENEGADNE